MKEITNEDATLNLYDDFNSDGNYKLYIVEATYDNMAAISLQRTQVVELRDFLTTLLEKKDDA
jgi:hypothetical protein